MLACSCYIWATDVGAPIVANALPPMLPLLISSFLLLLNNEDWPVYGVPPFGPPIYLFMFGEIPPRFYEPPPLRLVFKLLNFYYSMIL